MILYSPVFQFVKRRILIRKYGKKKMFKEEEQQENEERERIVLEKNEDRIVVTGE